MEKLKYKIEEKPEGIEDLLRSKSRWNDLCMKVKELSFTDCLRLYIAPKEDSKKIRIHFRQALHIRKIKAGVVIQNGSLVAFKR